MGKIIILPDNVANQIAAGEVVVRPASCVKEMAENSIDAGAENITVLIQKAGRKSIEIRDDGSGMEAADAETAFLRHATSKIRKAEDLNYISTMGFRGEALAAIASVSRLEIITKTEEAPAGTYIKFEAGKTVKKEERAANRGTSIAVKDLFYNTPARLKFLKSDYTEEAHIIEVVTALGLSHEGISFRLILDDKEVLFFPKDASTAERIRICSGSEVREAIVPASYFSDNVKVSGYVCKPSLTRQNNKSNYLFVNRRHVHSRRLSYAVYEGYATLLMRGNYPVTYLFLDINPVMVDVNVHPTKDEVKFREESAVFAAVKTAVAQALGSEELSINVTAESRAPYSPGAYAQGVQTAVESFYSRPQEALFEPFVSVKNSNSAVFVQSESRDYLYIRALGQINKTYIVGEDSHGLVVIDQHAAHEKALYEEIVTAMKQGGMKVQELLIPEVLEFTPAEKKIVSSNLESFEKLGFSLEEFGVNEYKITAHPLIIRDKSSGPFVRDIVSALTEKGGAQFEDALKDICATIACRAAVKAGDVLNDKEIEGLLRGYFEAKEPFSCPHGRPPVIKIGFEEIEKMFKRKL